MDLAVLQLEDGRAAVGRVGEVALLGQDGRGRPPGVQLVDRDALHLVGPAVHRLDQQVVAREVRDEDAFLELHGRAHPADIHQQAREGVVGIGVDIVVEQRQPDGQDTGAGQWREHGAEQVDAARPQGGDLIVLRQAAKRHERADQDRARHRERDHEPQRQPEKLQYGYGGHATVDDQVQVIEQDVHLEDERHDPESEHERNQMLAEDVRGKDTHGVAAYLMVARGGSLQPRKVLTTHRSADTVPSQLKAPRTRGPRNP